MVQIDDQSHYRIYMLRLWEERGLEPQLHSAWRLSIEDPRTGQRHGFASLEALTIFLQSLMDQSVSPSPDHVPTDEGS